MTFAWPQLLWLLALPLAMFAWDLWRRDAAGTVSHPKITTAEAGPRQISIRPPRATTSSARPWLVIGLAFSIVALARPQWGRIEEPVFDQSREIIIAIDLSRSMLTPDVKPSRLDRAKLLTQALLEKLTGERVGLIVFSGTAFLQSPLSADYEILREFLPALNPDYLPEGGTNYRALLDTALSAFASTTAADRFLIVLSDGEATEDNWRDRIDDLKTKGIRVIGLGVGTTTGALIPDGSGGLVKDERGAAVLSKLESGTLRELADKTGGVYADASTWVDLAGIVNATVEAGRKGRFTENKNVRLVERYQWPLAFAVWCLLVSAYYEFPVRPKPRDIKLTATPPGAPTKASPPAITTTALLVALGLGLVAARPLRAADEPSPALGRIYARVANQPDVSPQDYSEIAHETLRWGQRLKESGQPVIPGPVHDAIEAVDKLIAIDSKITDWTKLRAQLEALLEKPEDKKKQQPPPQQQQQNQQQQNQDQKQKQDNQQNQQQKDQPQQQKPQDSSQQNSSQQEQQNQQKQQQQQQKPEGSGEQKQSAFGDMKQQHPPPQMQKVGGVPEKKPEDGETPKLDASLALPTQKLDQLRNQDSPAELYRLIEGEKEATPRKKTKDW